MADLLTSGGYVPRIIMSLQLLESIRMLDARISELELITSQCPPKYREKRKTVRDRLENLRKTKAKLLESLQYVNSEEYKH